MKRELTCIVCPIGCSLSVDIQDGKVIDVKGNTCPRGKVYAENECVCPKRTITSSIALKNGEMLSVKTDKPIPKDKMKEVMKIINDASPVLPISVGDVIIENVFGSNIVATRNID